MAEQSYELMHKDDVVASLQLDDLSGAIKMALTVWFVSAIDLLYSFFSLRNVLPQSILDQRIQADLLRHCANRSLLVQLWRYADVKAALIGFFRLAVLCFAQRQIIVNRAMKISDKLGSARPLIGDQCTDTENLSEKQTIGFGEFNASDIPLILHCIVQITPSCSSTSSSCLT